MSQSILINKDKKYNLALLFVFTLFLFPNISHGYEFDKMQIHGFISQGYLQSDNNNFIADTKKGTFQFSEFGISFGTELTDELRIGLQLKARDIGDMGNNKIILDWAFGDYRYSEYLGIRAGKIKTPISIFSETRDADMLRTSVLLPNNFYIEYLRDFLSAVQGIGLYGNIDAGSAGDFSYQLQIGTTNISKDSGTVKSQELYGVADVTSVDTENVYVSDIRWETPIEGLMVGGSFKHTVITGHTKNSGDISYSPVIISAYYLEYILNDLRLVCEFFESRLQVTPIGLVQPMGYHCLVSYRINDWLETGTYYSMMYPERTDKDGEKLALAGIPKEFAWLEDYAFSIRFDINDFWIAKLEYHIFDGTAFTMPSLNDDFPNMSKNWNMFAAKLTFSF